MSLAVARGNLFVFERRQYSVLLCRLVLRNQFLRAPREQFCTTAFIECRLKGHNPAEPPGVGYDLVCEQTFECALGRKAGQQIRANGVKLVGVLVWQDSLARRQPVFDCIHRNVCFARGSARARASFSIESVRYDLSVTGLFHPQLFEPPSLSGPVPLVSARFNLRSLAALSSSSLLSYLSVSSSMILIGILGFGFPHS